MGDKVAAGRFDLADRQRYRQKMRTCLDALQRQLREHRFEGPRHLMGLEIELNLADAGGLPRMMNAEVLERIASGDFQMELGQFNLEVNIVPHRLGGRVLDQLAEELRTGLAYADRQARQVDARVVMIGILPTLTDQDLVLTNLSVADRYALLNNQIMASRGEEIALDIQGVEHLTQGSASIAPESACTSVQLHLQVTPESFPQVWNAAQAIAGPQIAMAANSPFLFGRELWRETRPPLFQQATDVRPPEWAAQGVRPRTWFGQTWVDSVDELFEENLRYFPSLLPISTEEDPVAELARGRTPGLSELVLHNGTVYRWNRPVYGVANGIPHLRVENRVLPAGPTVTDVLANAAFYYGLVRTLADEPRPVWQRMPFEVAQSNFDNACRYGLEAQLRWPRPGRGGLVTLPATRLVQEELLPLASAGLDAWGLESADRDRYLSVVEQRCRKRVNGASWQAAEYHQARESGLARDKALAVMTRRYCELASTQDPVHAWPVGV